MSSELFDETETISVLIKWSAENISQKNLRAISLELAAGKMARWWCRWEKPYGKQKAASPVTTQGMRPIPNSEAKKQGYQALFPGSRGDWIRTSDLLVPKQLVS